MPLIVFKINHQSPNECFFCVNFLSFQEIRIALRGKAIVLMGKNTMMRKAIRGHLEKNPELDR